MLLSNSNSHSNNNRQSIKAAPEASHGRERIYYLPRVRDAALVGKPHLQCHRKDKDKVQREGTQGPCQGDKVSKERQQGCHKCGESHVDYSGHKSFCDVPHRPSAVIDPSPCCVHGLIDRASIYLQENTSFLCLHCNLCTHRAQSLTECC